MGQELKKWKRRNSALKQIDEIESKRDNVLIIHYSCESFYDIKDGRTPRVTSIAVRNFSTGQTSSFSIHKSAEQMGANAIISTNTTTSVISQGAAELLVLGTAVVIEDE